MAGWTWTERPAEPWNHERPAGPCTIIVIIIITIITIIVIIIIVIVLRVRQRHSPCAPRVLSTFMCMCV